MEGGRGGGGGGRRGNVGGVDRGGRGWGLGEHEITVAFSIISDQPSALVWISSYLGAIPKCERRGVDCGGGGGGGGRREGEGGGVGR